MAGAGHQVLSLYAAILQATLVEAEEDPMLPYPSEE